MMPVYANHLHMEERANFLMPLLAHSLCSLCRKYSLLLAILSFLCEASSFPTPGKTGHSLLHSLSPQYLNSSHCSLNLDVEN